MKLPLLAVAVAALFPAAANAVCTVKLADHIYPADFERGRRAFLKCRACHTVKEGERNLVGPNLWKFMQRPANGAAGFAYSPAFQQAKPLWDIPALDAFIEKPAKAVPATRMVFAGIAKPEERADLLAWLARESGAPLPLCS